MDLHAVSRSETYATFALFSALAILASLRWLMPLDEIVYQWIQFHRTCGLERASRWIDPLVRGTLIVLIGTAIARGEWRQPGYLIGLLLVFLGGSFAVELLKTAIERLRPNSTPVMMSGNSFPSGHTTGAAMAAVIAILLIGRRGWPSMLRVSGYLVAVGAVVLQGIGRLLNGSHWLSDVTGSVLLGVAWMLGAKSIQRLPRVAMVGLLAAACLAFVVFDDVPETRLRLPSAIDETRSSLASIEFGTAEARSALGGEWGDGPAEPIGPVSWARSPEVTAKLHVIGMAHGILKVTLRPATGDDNRRWCARMRVTVNEWSAPEIALARGWREYHLEPPLGALKTGDNTIRFEIIGQPGLKGEEAATGLAAFRYLRLYPRA
jgi:membrane-associated phospholipid phosphatase